MKKLTPNYDEGMWKGAPVSSFLKAKELRKNETNTEGLLWEHLKGKQIKNYKFRRQHPINLYIADFYCHKLKLVIEIDGEYHFSEEQVLKDLERTTYLNGVGLEVIRFKNEEILENVNTVLSKLLLKVEELEMIEKLKNSIFPNPKGS